MAVTHYGRDNSLTIITNDGSVIKLSPEEHEALEYNAREILKTYKPPSFPPHVLAEMFPEARPYLSCKHKEYKSKLQEILESDRQYQMTYAAPSQREELEWYLDSNQKRREWVLKEMEKLDTILMFMNPKKKTEAADFQVAIAKAKAYPIDQLIQFNRSKGLCPWHEDRSPSLHYYHKKNNVHCFVCDKHGDAIDVYQQMKQCGLKEAVLFLSGQS